MLIRLFFARRIECTFTTDTERHKVLTAVHTKPHVFCSTMQQMLSYIPLKVFVLTYLRMAEIFSICMYRYSNDLN